jgi:hypothetical protein
MGLTGLRQNRVRRAPLSRLSERKNGRGDYKMVEHAFGPSAQIDPDQPISAYDCNRIATTNLHRLGKMTSPSQRRPPMFSSVPKALVTLAIAAVVIPPAVEAECVKVTPKMWLDAPSSELVFAGTLVELAVTGESGSKATFEVQRVWRGKVTKRFDVYMWHLASAESPRYLEKGQSYVVVAKWLEDKRGREGVGLDGSDAVAFTGVPCSDLHTVEEFVSQLGRGKPPIDEASGGKVKR